MLAFLGSPIAASGAEFLHSVCARFLFHEADYSIVAVTTVCAFDSPWIVPRCPWPFAQPCLCNTTFASNRHIYCSIAALQGGVIALRNLDLFSPDA